LVFAVGLVLSFFVGPAVGAALDFWLGPMRAHDAGALVAVIWFAAFLLAGAVAGHAIAGRRGQFAFSIAFGVFPVSAILFIRLSIAFLANYVWRLIEDGLELALFNIALS